MTQQQELSDIQDIPATTPAICIPHIEPSITINDIQKAFKEKLNLGKITYVRIIPRDNYSCAFVHLVWNEHEESRKIRRRLLKGKSIRFLYGDNLEETPWFWKCVATESSMKTIKKLEQ